MVRAQVTDLDMHAEMAEGRPNFLAFVKPEPFHTFHPPNLVAPAQVTELRLDMHAEMVGELSTNSSKEMAIEQSLASIAATWADLNLDMVPYKETHKGVYKLRGTEDVFVALEVGRLKSTCLENRT